MKVFHVFHIENNYSRTFVEVLNGMDHSEEHQIVFTQKVKNLEAYAQYNPLVFTEKNFFKGLNDTLCRGDKVYMHFFSTGPILFYYALNHRFFKKTTWVMWGSDVYHFKLKKHPIKKWVYERIRQRLIPQFQYHLGDENDYQALQNEYKVRGKFNYISYIIPGLEDQRKSEKVKSPVKILLGNSGDRANRHLEAFEVLKQFKDEDIHLILPMNYGVDYEYRKEVKAKGKAIFNDKITVLEDYLALVDYLKILDEVQIGYMNHKTQRGNGNLLKLLSLGVKVYMNQEVSLFETYKEQGIKVFATQELSDIHFNEFCQMGPEDEKNNIKLVNKFYNKEAVIRAWNQDCYDKKDI